MPSVLKLSNAVKKPSKPQQINDPPNLFKMTCTEFLGLVHKCTVTALPGITAAFLFVSAFNAQLTTLLFCNFILLVFYIFFASSSGFLLLGMTEDRIRSVSAPVLGTVSKPDAT